MHRQRQQLATISLFGMKLGVPICQESIQTASKDIARKMPQALEMLFSSLYVQRKFSDLFENRKALINNAALMGRIDASYTPQFAHALRGYLLIAAGRYAAGFSAFEQAGPTVNVEAQRSINEAARFGNQSLGFDAVSGRAYLETRVLAGDQHAQGRLNLAATMDSLGFNAETGRAYLDARVLAGDQHAQQMLNLAPLNCRLGFNPGTGRAYLDARVLAGDQRAQKYLNKMSGRAYLEARIQDHNDKDAQEILNWRAQWGRFGFTFKDTSVPWFFHFYNAIRGL